MQMRTRAEDAMLYHGTLTMTLRGDGWLSNTMTSTLTIDGLLNVCALPDTHYCHRIDPPST